MPKPSARIEAAISLLAPRPDEVLLEIGCGTGQAIQAILTRQPTVRITAIDRSGKAVHSARAVNGAAVAAGQASILMGDIERTPVADGGFDRAFAIRVNSFWTRPGVALAHLVASLRPGAEFWLIYDKPERKVAEPIMASLETYGIRSVRTEINPAAFAIIGRRLPDPGS